MAPKKRMERLRNAGISPTIQRLAILEYLEGTDSHPTAEQVYDEVRKTYPTIARATVYNALDALTKAGAILRLTVDPTASRYDADLDPHVHFRCRVCNVVYDIAVKRAYTLNPDADGHKIESVRTYAYGVCAACRDGEELAPPTDRRKEASNA
jgi:Fur family peroxide stress response transcriptional regulator